MAYFAEIDPEAALPTRVIGWYDTEIVAYPRLPDPERLVEMDSGQWAARMTTPEYDGEAFVVGPPPPRFVPPAVTLFQCRTQLRRMGHLAEVDGWVKSQGGEALDAWEYSNEVSRSGALVGLVAEVFGWTEEQRDDFFIQAAGITA